MTEPSNESADGLRTLEGTDGQSLPPRVQSAPFNLIEKSCLLGVADVIPRQEGYSLPDPKIIIKGVNTELYRMEKLVKISETYS